MRAFFLTPLVIFLLVFMVLIVKLLDTETGQSRHLIGQPVPVIQLSSLYGEGDFNTQSLKGKYYLLNIFAQWCLTCKIEHPFLLKLKEQGKIDIYGIDWKDDTDKVKAWLDEAGNPYSKIGDDKEGVAAIALAITGAPETLLISPDGIILERYAGVLNQAIFDEKFEPFIK